jgi:hypothetical protein
MNFCGGMKNVVVILDSLDGKSFKINAAEPKAPRRSLEKEHERHPLLIQPQKCFSHICSIAEAAEFCCREKP